MQYYIQSVHIKLSYFTIKLQSNTHLTYYSYNNPKRSETKLRQSFRGTTNQNRLFVEDYIRADWSNRVLVNRIGKEGSYLHSIRKSTEFRLEEKSA
jgi:hypothetical protein